MEELAAREVDLIILSDNTTLAVKNTLGVKVTDPKFVSYLPDEDEEKDIRFDCSQVFNLQPHSSPEPDMTCNGSEVLVSKVEALVAVIQQLEWTQILILYEESQGRLNTLYHNQFHTHRYNHFFKKSFLVSIVEIRECAHVKKKRTKKNDDA